MRIKALLVLALVLSCPVVVAAQAAGQIAPAAPSPTPAASAPVDAKNNPATGVQPVAAPADNSGTQPLSTTARGQFLFGWTPNPGTSFYVGYNDDLQRNGYNPFNSQLEPGLRRNGRTFFIKASYLFRRSF